MKNVVLLYLSKHYNFKYSTSAAFMLFDKIEKKDIGLKTVLEHLKLIFSLDNDTVLEYFDEWAEIELIKIEDGILPLAFPLL